MKRLLWKEFHERWWWALLWGAAMLGVSLFAQGQAFYGGRAQLASPWQMLPLALALLTGTGSYASELTGTRAQFTFSRPIGWRRLLLAKLLFGGSIVFAAPLLAAVLLRLFGPVEYRPFVTLAGVWAVSWKMGLLYLVGMGCSVVLAGFAGGFLTLLAIVAVGAAAQVVFPSWPTIPVRITAVSTGIWLGIGIAVLTAGWRVARHALTLGVDERVKRFVFAYVPLSAACIVVAAVLPIRWERALLYRWDTVATRVSPGGSYALTFSIRHPFYWPYTSEKIDDISDLDARMRLIRMADGARVKEIETSRDDVAHPSLQQYSWATDDIAYRSDRELRSNGIRVLRADTGRETFIPFNGMYFFPLLSPDGALLAVQTHRPNPATRKYEGCLQAVDLRTGRTIGKVPVTDRWYCMWWSSNEEVCYRTMDGEIHRVHIPRKP